MPAHISDAIAASMAQVSKCPYHIFIPEHYRPDGRCRCDDPMHQEMREWGYEWAGEKWVRAR